MLYASVPTLSVWPPTSTLTSLLSFRAATSLSRFPKSASRTAARSKSKFAPSSPRSFRRQRAAVLVDLLAGRGVGAPVPIIRHAVAVAVHDVAGLAEQFPPRTA